MKRFVIAIDGSPGGREALEYGLDLAAAQHAEVRLVHVIPPTDWTHLDRGRTLRPLAQELMLRGAAGVSEARALAEERGIAVTVDVVAGLPADEIVAYADANDADLIIVGSRGRGPVASAVLGGVSRAVLNEARRPVLVVRNVPARARRAPLEEVSR